MLLTHLWRTALAVAATVALGARLLAADSPYQYQSSEIRISKPSADEPIQSHMSARQAVHYLDEGARAWNESRKCITCHTNGTYMLVRPSLTAQFGRPSEEMRTHFVKTLKGLSAMKRKDLLRPTRPAQVIYGAAGLAEWDAHITKSLSPETEQALALMFELQELSGTWGSADCWPPYESDAFHEATVAAIAVADAPGWLAKLKDPALVTGVERLKRYLQTTEPPHDYGRVLLLWASARMPGLLDKERQQAIIERIWSHQREDGGWSIRSFARPEQWGHGKRAPKLRSEPEFRNPPSDGHQTGMVIVALREAGVPASDPRIQRGVAWLMKNQRTSGRWWTRSLNTDNKHFITYSGTAFPVLALSLCNALPQETAATAK